MAHQQIDFKNDWLVLLVDVALCDGKTIIFSDRPSPSIDRFESIVNCGLALRAISLLDKAAESKLTPDTARRSAFGRFYDRIRELDSRNMLVDYDRVDAWRIKRNSIGHDLDTTLTKEDLKDCLECVYIELKNLGIVDEYPELKMRKTIQRVAPSHEDISIEQDVTILISGSYEGNAISFKRVSKRQAAKSGPLTLGAYK